MRIGLVTDLELVNSRYRGIPILRLDERGHQVQLAWQDGLPRFELLAGCEAVHITRYHGPETRRVMKELREAGVGVVWDNDDDLTTGAELTKEGKKKRALRAEKMRAEMIRTIRLAHVVTTPSEHLAQQYRDWGAECVRLVGNYIPDEYEIPHPVSRHAGLTVGWLAGQEHRHDLLALGLRETLQRLLDNDASVRVVSIGIHLGLTGERYDWHPRFQYWDLAPQVAMFDVGLAPLDDIPFNRARSDVKLKEYAAAQVPWLASPIGPYADLGERQGGRLVQDDAWFNEVNSLLLDKRGRDRLAKRGGKWAQGETLVRNIGRWERVLAEASARASV